MDRWPRQYPDTCGCLCTSEPPIMLKSLSQRRPRLRVRRRVLSSRPGSRGRAAWWRPGNRIAVGNRPCVNSARSSKPWGYFVAFPTICAGIVREVELERGAELEESAFNWVPDIVDAALKRVLPHVLEMSSLNCHLRWKDCCGTLVLVPKEALGKTTRGELICWQSGCSNTDTEGEWVDRRVGEDRS